MPFAGADGKGGTHPRKPITVIPRFLRGTHLSAASEERIFVLMWKLNHGSRA